MCRESERDNIDLLTVPQVAEKLHISKSHAYALAREGILPVIRLGKAIRVPAVALGQLGNTALSTLFISPKDIFFGFAISSMIQSVDWRAASQESIEECVRIAEIIANKMMIVRAERSHINDQDI